MHSEIEPRSHLRLKRTQYSRSANKKIIVIAGKRTRGTHAAIVAFTKNITEIMKGNIYDENVTASIVHGIDSNGDGSIDSVKFLE